MSKTSPTKPAPKTAAKSAVKSKSPAAKASVPKPRTPVVKPKTAAKPKAPTKATIAAKPKPAVKPAVKPAAAKAKPSGGGARAGGGSAHPVRVMNGPAKSTAVPVAAPASKVKKSRLVRDSFTMPEAEYQVLGDVKKACLKQGIAVKKSELLRVGIALIRSLDIPSLKKILSELPPLKAGRPKNEK